MRAPISFASAIARRMKARTSGSSRMRSQVAPVNADTGFMVMLPQSLNQMSFWMQADTSISKPAPRSKPASASSRFEAPPDGSPRISVWPKPWRTRPGSGIEQVACTTPPITCCAGMPRAMLPSASTAFNGMPECTPPKPLKNHHGTPFIAVSTTVSGPSSGAIPRATPASVCAFTATTTRSCTPSSAGSSASTTGAVTSWSPSCSRQPCVRSACATAPRAMADTATPAAASRVPMNPPMAPAP